MNRRQSPRLIKKRQLTNDEDQRKHEVQPKKIVAKRAKIQFSGDILREVLACLSLGELPAVTLTNRRFWAFCDENLNGRKHTIQGMEVSGGLDGVRIIFGGSRVVPFAQVEPPPNFHLTFIHVREGISRKAMAFLRVSSPMFAGGRLNFTSFITNRLLNMFNGCAQVSIKLGQTVDGASFFDERTIANSISVRLFNTTLFFEPNTIVKWLHSPIGGTYGGLNSKKQRQLYFRECYGALIPHPLVNAIKKRFSKDTSPHRFVLRLNNSKCESVKNFRVEKPGTDEVLFSRINGPFWELIRCGKAEGGTMKYEVLTGGQYPIITV